MGRHRRRDLWLEEIELALCGLGAAVVLALLAVVWL